MALRKEPLVTGEIYHVFNRGVEKRSIVIDDHDRERWLLGLNYYRYENTPIQLSLASQETFGNLHGQCLVRILAYCLMPNHFHLLLEPLVESGASHFLQKFMLSYSRYFNQRHQRVGSLFQGRFQSRRIPTTDLLLHVCRYIHLNPYVAGLIDDLRDYRWSSYPEYLYPNLAKISEPGVILRHFPDSEAFQRFVLDHGEYAKSLESIKHLAPE